VNRQGIYVAWDHVLKGYAAESDGYNVGLHEMAHAFEYELAFGDYAHDHTLKYNFGKVIGALKQYLVEEPHHSAALYSQQGLSNIHECWAESVEFFFEKPALLKTYYPFVYEAMSALLNQQPHEWKAAAAVAGMVP
jgi:MtfA peptidase